MGRKRGRKSKLPQVPKTQKSDGLDVEYSEELADVQDRESVARSNAADKQAKKKKKK
ncbi:YfhD family protein [Pallidibacillus pasinlerensis]|uniref:YfhD family protein n=1 Tax=Pallidibacillus pasinlerensis TaxID=2703818 RepID=A0ABX0A2N0_9BACI|nr:YfhD family protein [Pallidibacillus pasinlerensis]NCU17621.1 YfhD family protein [Pallidibacillus pasinlerensis]